MGKEAEPIYKSFVYAGDDEDLKLDYKTIIAKFDELFMPKRKNSRPSLLPQVCGVHRQNYEVFS